VADKVKIHEIAKTIGISSTELIEVCQRAGYADVKHHSQAVPADRAEEIRKAAIRLYRPKQRPTLKPRAERAPKQAPPPPPPPAPRVEKAEVEPPKRIPSTRDVKPVPPPESRPEASRLREQAEEAEVEAPPERELIRPRRREPPKDKVEEVKRRTIVFRRPKRVVEKKREEKVEMMRPVTVRELSERLGILASEIIKDLMLSHNVRASINQTLEDELVQLLGIDYGVEVILKEPRSAEDVLLESMPKDRPEDLVPRPPVITMLGHVDHGKTTILDRIRNTRVAESEAGGITQDIGAWQTVTKGQWLTFIDTPGHEAFTAMRARGAKVTDVVVLVVAADDGPMPQTIEAINHARAASVPIVVAVNKVDKPEANPLRVRQQLAGLGVNSEEWGGNVGFVDVSGLTGQGIPELLDRITLEAELLEVKANPNRPAVGAVLEARMQPGRGVVTDIIVQNGTLRRGDIAVCGNAFGTVRALFNDRGEEVAEAGPGQPVSVSGLNHMPEAGDTFLAVDDNETARNVAGERQRQLERKRLQPRRHVTLENLYESILRGERKHLNVIVKADVQGSLDPLVKSLGELGDEEVSVRLIHSGTGPVNRSDVLLADASDAIVLAFRAGMDEKVRQMAAECGVEILEYTVIYDVTDQIRSGLEGLLEPEEKEERLGQAEVRQIFRISRLGTIAGCYVTEGVVRRNARVRVIREGQVLHEGAMASLRQVKNDVREVESGRECGINVEGFNDVRPGDLIECFTTVRVRRKLSPKAARQPVTSEAEKSAGTQR
jgi:translation initiation factor IF-2